MRRCSAVSLLLSLTLVGCSGVLLRAHITDIDIAPRTLPPEGGKVKIVVKAFNADRVWVGFKRSSDGKTFTASLSPEFWLGFLTGESKWDGEIKLPPNDDPEGEDEVYEVTVKAWNNDGWEHARDDGKILVKGKASGQN